MKDTKNLASMQDNFNEYYFLINMAFHMTLYCTNYFHQLVMLKFLTKKNSLGHKLLIDLKKDPKFWLGCRFLL